MISRYSRTPKLNLGSQYGTSNTIIIIRNGIKDGTIPYTTIVLKGLERLDTLAGSIYGDGKYWWILAAASNIGWAPQVQPGTLINVPDFSSVIKAISLWMFLH